MSAFCVNAFLLWGGIPQGQYPLAGFILPYQAGNDAGGTEAEKDIVHGAVYGERTLQSVDDFRRFRKKTAEEKGCIGGHEDDDEGKHSPARVLLPALSIAADPDSGHGPDERDELEEKEKRRHAQVCGESLRDGTQPD